MENYIFRVIVVIIIAILIFYFFGSNFAKSKDEIKKNEIDNIFDEIDEEEYDFDNKKLIEPVDYTLKGGGKNTRALIYNYTQSLLNNKNENLSPQLIEDVDIFHNCTLVIDDIEDGSLKRRGQKCAHLVYGMPLTLNAGYLKIFQILENVHKKYPILVRNKILELYIQAIRQIHIGQGYDIIWTKEGYIPNMDEYLFMIDNKTGVLFDLSAKLCFVTYANSKGEINKYKRDQIMLLIKNIGRFFQIRDDYINLTSPKYWREKGFCEDLDEKKVSHVFATLKQLDPKNDLYKQMCKKDKLTTKDKKKIYSILYRKRIFHQIHLELDMYKKKIIAIEKRITKKEKKSAFLNMLFKKLYYPLPIEPYNIKYALFLNDKMFKS